MRKNSSFNHFVMLATAAVAMLMASCIKDEVVDVPFIPTESETIGFGINLENLDDTRAASRNRVGKHDLKSADGEFTLPMGVYVEDGIHSANADKAETRGAKLETIGNSFTVWASLANGNTSTLFFDAKGVVFENDGTSYKSNPAYFWPGAGTLNFTAVANAPESGFVPNLNTAGTALESFTYTVPADATAQEDIVVATASVGGANNATVPLNFKHIMSAVNFTVGKKVANGVIKSITINNIKTTGSYNVATGTWTPNTDKKDSYSVAFFSPETDGTYEPNGKTGAIINDDECTFMMMPQVLDADAEVVVEFIYDNAPSDVKKLRANIAIDPNNTSQRREWKMGKTTYYSLSVDENYNLTITPKGDVLDAHYVMTDVTVNIDTEKDQAWTLTVEATHIDSDKVSIEYQNKLIPLITTEGYWLDKIKDGTTETSARGVQTVKGTTKGAHTITVFIPENITANERKITLTLSLDSDPTNKKKTEYLYQMCPYWDREKGFGWERVENNDTGAYGFNWDRVVCYVFPYAIGSLVQVGSSTFNRKTYSRSYIYNNIMETIKEYNAEDYVTIQEYMHEERSILSDQTRYCVIIDYTKIPAEELHIDDPNNGLTNTRAFFDAANLLKYEEAIKGVMKAEYGKGNENTYRIPNNNEATSTSLYYFVKEDSSEKTTYTDAKGRVYSQLFMPTGNMDDMSGILMYVVKRNKFNCIKSSIGDEVVHQTYTVEMNSGNIQWYLPAKNQFLNPVLSFATGNTTFIPSQFWSSTAHETDTQKAYLGEGEDYKTEKHKVVVQRIVTPIPQPTTISEIDTEEMKGGENGEAQWVE